jgi:RNA polymerase sigma factor (sigma-70 family)
MAPADRRKESNMFEHDAYEEARAIFNKLYWSGGLKNPEVKKVYQNNVQYWRLRLPEYRDDDKKDGSKNPNRKQYYGHPTSLDKATEEFGFMPADSFSLEDYVIRKEVYQALYAAIDSLEEVSRDIIILLYFEEKSEDDAAAELGLTKGKVHYQKGKIIEKLTEILKDFR